MYILATWQSVGGFLRRVPGTAYATPQLAFTRFAFIQNSPGIKLELARCKKWLSACKARL